MRSTAKLSLVAMLIFACSAQAFELPGDAPTLAPSMPQAGWHGASPVRGGGIRSGGSSDLVINGLILVGVGLVAGAGGFGLMMACPETSQCYSTTLNTVAWVLAAPGIIPLAVGAFMIYLGTPHYSELFTPKQRSWAFAFAPSPGGGTVGALGSF